MLRGPIRFITNEIEGFARVMHKFNAQGPEHHLFSPDEPAGTPQHHWFGPDDPGYKQHRLFGPDHEAGTPEHHLFGPDDPGYHNPHRLIGPDDPVLPETGAEKYAREHGGLPSSYKGGSSYVKPKADDEHLQPILHTSFGNVADLQQKMQAMSTENPAQERGLSIMEQLYNMLVKIYNKLPGDTIQEIPNPAVRND